MTPDDICGKYAEFALNASSLYGMQKDMGNLFLLENELPVYGCGVLKGKKLVFPLLELEKRVVFSSTVRYMNGLVFTVFEE
jgi:hypothetical protein